MTAYNVLEEGDIERGFADADAIVEAEYQVPFFNQTYMEPNGGDGSRGGRRKADGLGRRAGDVYQAGGGSRRR